MTREAGDVVRLSFSSWLVIAGIAVTICLPIVGGLISIKSDQAAMRATLDGVVKQVDRLEGRVR